MIKQSQGKLRLSAALESKDLYIVFKHKGIDGFKLWYKGADIAVNPEGA